MKTASSLGVELAIQYMEKMFAEYWGAVFIVGECLEEAFWFQSVHFAYALKYQNNTSDFLKQ